MEHWKYYGIIAAIFISCKDLIFVNLIKKYNYIDLIVTTNTLIFIFTFLYIIVTKTKIKKIKNRDLFGIVIEILLIYLIINPAIYYSMKNSSNPGNAKALINLNALITLIFGFFVFKTKMTFRNIILIIIILSISFKLE